MNVISLKLSYKFDYVLIYNLRLFFFFFYLNSVLNCYVYNVYNSYGANKYNHNKVVTLNSNKKIIDTRFQN